MSAGAPFEPTPGLSMEEIEYLKYRQREWKKQPIYLWRALAELQNKVSEKSQKEHENQITIDGLNHFFEKGYFPIKIPDITDVLVGYFFQGYATIYYHPNRYSLEHEGGWIDFLGKELKIGYQKTFSFTELGIAAFLTKDNCLGIINTDGDELLIENPKHLDCHFPIEFHDYNGTICSRAVINEFDSKGYMSSSKQVLIDINGKILYTAKKGHYIKWSTINKDKRNKTDIILKRNLVMAFIDYIPNKRETTIIF